MKRFAPLLLIVFALAGVPAAFADEAPAPSAPSAPAAKAGGHPMARIQLEMLRIRLQLVHLRYQIACHKQDSDRCTQFTQKVTGGLTKLDQNVQDRIAKKCTSTTSTDKRCDVLAELDQKLQVVIAKLGSAPSVSGDSGLDNAVGSLAGSTKP